MVNRQWLYTAVCMVAWMTPGLAQSGGGPWIPPQQTSWQWQLTGPVDLSVNAAVYDIDLFTTDASVVQQLHQRGRRAICYVSVGTYEPFRPDSGQFPAAVRGRRVSGFPDETWLDIRRLDVLAPIMEARLDLCKAKGFDAVEPDNVDGYDNNSGFDLTYADQLAYNRYIAKIAHDRGLSVGLKNDLGQVPDLVDEFDWALNEQCFQYDECNTLARFINAGKAVFHVEYELEAAEFCPAANAMQFNSLEKNYDLGASGTPCRAAAVEGSLAAVRNGASGWDEPVAPGEIISLYGVNLGPEDLVVSESLIDGRFPTDLAGTRVLIGGIAAPLLFVRTDQAGAIVPYGIAPAEWMEVAVFRDGIRTSAIEVRQAAVAPGIFTADASGRGQAAALNQDGSLNSPANPEQRGRIIVLYATGEGQTTPAGEDGLPALGELPAPVLPVEVFIGGQRATVHYAGAAPGLVAGLMQVNAGIPPDAAVGDAVEVVIRVGTAASQADVTIAVRQ
jgi:uncharacterized protein (TIGR03437 family)